MTTASELRPDFAGQGVLVTGASSGIGAAAAEGLAALGAQVVLHFHRNQDGAEATARAIEDAGGSASTMGADLSDGDAAGELVDRAVERLGRIDVLVNNAGDLVQRMPVAQMSDEDFHKILDVNITSAFSTCRRVVPVMRQQGSGSIVNLTSIAARTGGAGGSVVYATSKAAVSTFTRGLAKEVAQDGIRVNAISPGIILTPFHERHTAPDQMTAMVSGIPMGRAGSPQECVGAIAFLASPAMSGYVTGQILEVNGGQYTP